MSWLRRQFIRKSSTPRRIPLWAWWLLVVIALATIARDAEGNPVPLLGARAAFTSERKRELRELVRKTFYHGFDNYMKHAFPKDELKPISCTGLGHDRINPRNHEVNDVLGDFSLTLVDSLSTLAILGDRAVFARSVRLVIAHVSFDLDSRVQVFEVTIRMLGGLLSGHLYAEGKDIKGWKGVKGYKGELLVLAEDLGKRLLPAFTQSPTGIPYSRVNLRHGILKGESSETCTAAAGSLLLEFAALSRLTGNPVFEQVARKAFYALWHRRSPIGLFGNTIDMVTGKWMYGVSSVGAGIDSIYEYMAKAFVLLGDQEYWRVWDESYASVMKYIRGPEGFWYRGVNMQTGGPSTVGIDSLSAFWPGLQVLAGDVESAIQSHLVYANLWRRYGGIPEVFDIQRREASSLSYPLRPEFLESNYFLYRATQDSFYLDVAEQAVSDIINKSWVDCGLALVENLETGNLEDRMHSFALSETLMYLYLTFDEAHPLNHDDSPLVFTTEGHPLFIPLAHAKQRRPPKRRSSLKHAVTPPSHSRREAPKCPAYEPYESPKYPHELQLTIEGRTDAEFARSLVGYQPEGWLMEERGAWSEYGWCEVSKAEEFLLELLFSSPNGEVDDNPGPKKVKQTSDGLLIRNVQGLRVAIQRRLDGQGYDVRKVGSYRLPLGSSVILADPAAVAALTTDDDARTSGLRATVTSPLFSRSLAAEYPVMRASFGPDILAPSSSNFALQGPPIQLLSAPSSNPFVCAPLQGGAYEGVVILARRGQCEFQDKARHAAHAGAKGVIVSNDEEELVVPTASAPDGQKLVQPGALVPLVLARNSTGVQLEKLLNLGGKQAKVDLEVIALPPDSGVVVINGYKLVNVQIKR